jgi:hypothetical protein
MRNKSEMGLQRFLRQPPADYTDTQALGHFLRARVDAG